MDTAQRFRVREKTQVFMSTLTFHPVWRLDISLPEPAWILLNILLGLKFVVVSR